MLLPITDHILNRIESLIRALPHEVFLRAGDAIHIVSAVEAGFKKSGPTIAISSPPQRISDSRAAPFVHNLAAAHA
jgi:hypothetical protein